MADLASLIRTAIEMKGGDKDFALFFSAGWGGAEPQGPFYDASLGNPTNCASLGETPGEIESGRHETPEEAVMSLIRQMQSKSDGEQKVEP